MTRTTEMLTVEDSGVLYTLREVCERGGCHAELVIKMVNYGIVEPAPGAGGEEGQQWAFDLPSLLRIQKAIRLQRDLNINLPGLAMSLDLLDEMDTMRREISCLRQRLAQFSSGAGEE